MKRHAGIVVFFAMVMGLAVLGCMIPTTDPPPAKIYAIGATGPAGGLVFYDKGSYSEGWRYLEAAPVDQPIDNVQNDLRNSNDVNIPDPRLTWNGNGEYAVIGASATAIGAGKANTDLIVAALGASTGCAATQCATSRIGGFSDWFLPSRDEVVQMLHVYNTYSDYSSFETVWYWSSSEYNDVQDYAALFACTADISNSGDPQQSHNYKDMDSGTRAIRRF
jgi:hypothetical protein